MAIQNDNRMGWIRNLEQLKTIKRGDYFVEHEIASECRIPGILDYEDGKIRCGLLMLDKDKNGLYHYLMRVKHAGPEEPYFNQNANSKGYYFPKGILGELLSLFSIYFQCRFYILATYSGDLSDKGLRIKTEHNFLYKPVNQAVHRKILSGEHRNFAKGLEGFLDQTRKLNPKNHQDFILACYHYSRALKEVGMDSEMVFIRLVSAIEILSSRIKLNKKLDIFHGKSLSEFIDKELLSKEQIEELQKVFNVRKSRLKFINFVETYCSGAFKGGKIKAAHLKIKRTNLPKELRAIYEARSEYLHNGEPMYLSQFMHGADKWDTDPSLGMIMDNRQISGAKKLPYTYWFENLVRQCLLNYLRGNLI